MSALRTLTRFARPLSTTSARLADPSGPGAKGPSTSTPDTSTSGPQSTQGHTTTKSHRLDVQNDNAQAGQNEHASSGGQGHEQPIDAARMGGTGGEAKQGTEGKGPFKDQVGGQPGSSGDVKMGEETEVPGTGWTGRIKNALGGNKAFHTSARSYASSARKPVESNLKGDQNQHLKHKDASASDSGKGNAAADPHLPSHSKNKSAQSGDKSKSAKSPKGTVAYHTSAVRWGETERDGPGYAGAHAPEPKKAGYDTPEEALPPNLESNYNRAESTPPKPNMTPSSEAQYSSTAVDPPNAALKDAVKQGGQSGELDLSRNAQPSGEVGKKGNAEAWKDRK